MKKPEPFEAISVDGIRYMAYKEKELVEYVVGRLEEETKRHLTIQGNKVPYGVMYSVGIVIDIIDKVIKDLRGRN